MSEEQVRLDKDGRAIRTKAPKCEECRAMLPVHNIGCSLNPHPRAPVSEPERCEHYGECGVEFLCPKCWDKPTQDDFGPEPSEWREQEINLSAFCRGCKKAFTLGTFARVYSRDGRWVRFHEDCWPWLKKDH